MQPEGHGGQLFLDPAAFDEPHELVDAARALLEHDERQGALPGTGRDDGRLWGVRPDAGWRRNVAGGRPELGAGQLELAWRGLDRRHRREEVWTDIAIATAVEVSARCMSIEDLGGLRGLGIPDWFAMKGSDGKPLVPRRLRPYVACHWWAYALGRFGLHVSAVELAGKLDATPRTIRNWRSAAVALGLVRRGEQQANDRARRDASGRHTLVDRSWRIGDDQTTRTSDQARNISRLGPVLESIAGLAAGETRPKGHRRPRGALRAAHALRRQARRSMFEGTNRLWHRDRHRPSAGEGVRAVPTATHYRLSAERKSRPESPPEPLNASAATENFAVQPAHPFGAGSGTRGPAPEPRAAIGTARRRPATRAAAPTATIAGDFRADTPLPSRPTTAVLRSTSTNHASAPAAAGESASARGRDAPGDGRRFGELVRAGEVVDALELAELARAPSRGEQLVAELAAFTASLGPPASSTTRSSSARAGPSLAERRRRELAAKRDRDAIAGAAAAFGLRLDDLGVTFGGDG